MDDPLGLADGLSDLYRKYLNSALPLRDERLMRERQRLLTEPGALCQEPLLEPVPRYEETLTLSEAVTQFGLHPDLPAFAACGLFPANRRLYQHQVEALDAVLKQRHHLVVTTGTGSGKTECFLLPIMATLVQESATWPHTGRPRAVRALLLYPLNALAEDQMMRLRRAADSVDAEGTVGARTWLDQHRQGHRFFFGRYTGHTPVSGPQCLPDGRPNTNAQRRLREQRRELQRQLTCLRDQPKLRYHFPSLDANAAECWDRWTMQAQPPDILVTNYSMLNIMLMRRVESPLFEQTRAWLAGDPSRVFHLVVDELHTYRGTAGTEVAYLLRLLLQRLGIHPDSPQVRFLSSSASLTDDEASRQYLKEFFGVSGPPSHAEKFTVITGTPSRPVHPVPASLRKHPVPASLRKHADAFAAFRDDWRHDRAAGVQKLAQRLGAGMPREVPPQVALHHVLRHAQVPDAVLAERPAEPETPAQLGARLFDDSSARTAVAGLLHALAVAREGDQFEAAAPLPLREHLFFRNVLGLWACADPQCSAVDDGDCQDAEPRMLGKLYWTPRLVCTCGARVLDVLLCRTCGEVYYGGYRGKGRDQADYLVHDQPALETIPGRPVSIYEKKYDTYAVFWPARENPIDKTWTDREGKPGQEVPVKKGWKQAVLNPITGRMEPTQRQHNGWLYNIEPAGSYNAFPGKCARCDADWRRGRFTPIGPHATGVQKVNQVLADGLMRQITASESRKLVVFTDSRQDAAKLAAGIELDHYRDLVRQALMKGFAQVGGDLVAALKFLDQGPASLSQKEDEARRRFADLFGADMDAIRNVRDGCDRESDRQRVAALRTRIRGPYALVAVEEDVWARFLQLGCNPAGPQPSRQKSDTDGDMSWTALVHWDRTPLQTKQPGELGKQQTFLADLKRLSLMECVYTLFAHKRKSVEALGLGWVTVSPEIAPHALPIGLSFSAWRMLVDVTIRLMGERRRIAQISLAYPVTSFPGTVRQYIQRITTPCATFNW